MAQEFYEGRMRKPDIVCIGAQKAGTTWFHSVFGTRPDIWVPPFKEMHFFDHLYGDDSHRWSKGHIMRSIRGAVRYHVMHEKEIALDYVDYLCSLTHDDMFSRRWYGRIWDRAGEAQMPLDVTPEYSCISAEGVEHFKRMLGKCKVIYILRDPASRAASQIRMGLTRRNTVPKNMDDWIAEIERPEIDNRGDYRTYVPRWKAAYKPDQLLFMPFKQIASDPDGFLREVEDFIGLKPFKYARSGERVHEGQGIRVPDEVKDLLRMRYADQYQFLADEFSPEFLAQI